MTGGDLEIEAAASRLILAALNIAAKAAGHKDYRDSFWEATADWSAPEYIAALDAVRRSAASSLTEKWDADFKLYRIEGGPQDNCFIQIYTDGMVMLCSNAGSCTVEPEPMTWTQASALRMASK